MYSFQIYKVALFYSKQSIKNMFYFVGETRIIPLNLKDNFSSLNVKFMFIISSIFALFKWFCLGCAFSPPNILSVLRRIKTKEVWENKLTNGLWFYIFKHIFSSNKRTLFYPFKRDSRVQKVKKNYGLLDTWQFVRQGIHLKCR